MTHRDEINNMSNEELAEFITIVFVESVKKIYGLDDAYEKECQKCTEDITEWLNMEVEE